MIALLDVFRHNLRCPPKSAVDTYSPPCRETPLGRANIGATPKVLTLGVALCTMLVRCVLESGNCIDSVDIPCHSHCALSSTIPATDIQARPEPFVVDGRLTGGSCA